MKYSRKIAALLPKRYTAFYLRSFLFIILTIQALLLIIFIYGLNIIYEHKRDNVWMRDKSFLYWSTVVRQYPNAPDILFNAAKSAYEDGKPDNAIIYLEKALRIDPLFAQAQKLKKELEK